MKNLFCVLALFSIYFIDAQSFTGKGDSKLQVGVSTQKNATGLNLSYDIGIAENISLGLSGTYAIGVSESIDIVTGDRFDLRARFNANIGNVLNIDPNFDLYPGLSFGIKNFGGHLGARYFFTSGFGIYSEVNIPISKYDTGKLSPSEEIHNQFTINFGAVFNL